MRFVPISCLREGMQLARRLYGKNGSLLLQQGIQLKQSYISHIKYLGYQGVYIYDEISKDITIKTVIDDEMRSSAVNAVRDIYAQSGLSGISQISADNTKGIVNSLVSEISKNKNVITNMIDLKSFDDYTYYHSVNVAVLSLVMGVEMGLNQNDLHKLGLSAMLHDIGKVFMNKELLDKEEPLTINEFRFIKNHAQVGYDYLFNARHLDVPATALAGVLQHHERLDGSGYPSGNSGKRISQFGRIIAIADVFDAITSDRPYRKAMTPSEAMEYLMGGAGVLFDSELVMLFTRKVAAYPLGTCVRLSNGLDAIVVENYEDCCTRPRVRLITSYEASPVYFDLKNDRSITNITITDVIAM